jgi:DNA processing protein
MQDAHYLGWVALGLVPGLGARLTAKLLDAFGSPEAIFAASLTSLEACRIPPAAAKLIAKQEPLRAAEKELEALRKHGWKLLTWEEPHYSEMLKQIYDPPPLLYVRGDPALLKRHAVAIVGTRRPSPYGNQMASRLARELAERGLVIVSGLARGIDSTAHKGALEAANGASVAVLGTGLDVIYPKENRKLFAQMEERGAIITEFPLGTYAAPQNFPIRNRIIAGMSLGVVVVEGAEHSGSLITARLAMEFNREVYGVPGNVTQSTSFGPNLLIKQGAKLVTQWQDVVDELPTEIRAELLPVETPGAAQRTLLAEESLPPAERTLYALLSTDKSRHVDELVEESQLTSSEALAALFELEMKSLVRQLPGKNFLKVLL